MDKLIHKRLLSSSVCVTMCAALLAVFMMLGQALVNPAFAQWEQLPGKAQEIAAGGTAENPSVWTIGRSNAAYKWNEQAFAWENFGGKATVIAVDTSGTPWVINDQQIYRLRGRTWQAMPGKATEIDAGGGAVWSLGQNTQAYKWNEQAFAWESYGGKAEHIAVDSDGTPWVINNQQIYRLRGRTWQAMPGKAQEIAAGGGEVFSIGQSNQVYRWNEQAFSWINIGGKADKIAVTADGTVWAIEDDPGGLQIYRWRGSY